MPGSDSEESRPADAPDVEAMTDVPGAPEGAVIAEAAVPEVAAADAAPEDEASGGAAADEGGEGGVSGAGNANGEAKPSYTLHFHNLPPDMEDDELSTRLERFGKVVSVEKEGEITVAKFTRTTDAYEAREKLNGSVIEGCTLQVEFGPQDSEHYSRGAKKRWSSGEVRKVFLDGEVAAAPEGAVDGEVAATDAPMDKDKAADEGKDTKEKAQAGPGALRSVHDLVKPEKPVSAWAENQPFEKQLEDYMKMQRRGMYNRYLVVGKLPPQLRTEMAMWHLAAPVQHDVLRVEMITCFGKPVAHVALRSATAAAAMHRLAEHLHPTLTVAFAPPRQATRTLWLGNVDDFVPRKELEALLAQYGKLVGGLRYIPARTCAFVQFQEVTAATAARNALYSLEVQRNQYLNVDFVEDADRGSMDGAEPSGAWLGGKGAHMPPWGPPEPLGPWMGGPDWWGGKGGGKGWKGVKGGWPPPRRPGDWNDRGQDRRRSRSRSGRRGRSRSGSGRGCKKELQVKGSSAKVKLFKMGEFCCNIVANAVKGPDAADPLVSKLQIDQRTKVDHCRSHMDKAGLLVAIWHFSAADRKDCAAYDALCDYFVEKQRVGLVQTPSYYLYIVPPTEKYLKELKLPVSNLVVGIQIPVKK